MDSANPASETLRPAAAAVPQIEQVGLPADFPPWEEIATGRYMPRRIRGSCRGRALG